MKSQNINKQNAAMECQPKKKVSDRLTKAEKKDEQASLVDRLSSIDIASNSGGSHMATRSKAQQNSRSSRRDTRNNKNDKSSAQTESVKLDQKQNQYNKELKNTQIKQQTTENGSNSQQTNSQETHDMKIDYLKIPSAEDQIQYDVQKKEQDELTQLYQKLIENRGNHPNLPLGPSTTDYYINDYNINVLPDKNPIQRVIEDFVSKRHAYQNFKVKDSNTSSSNSATGGTVSGGQSQSRQNQQRPMKPRFDDFLYSLQEHVFMVNKIYKVSKQQFEDDMKAFKNCELFDEQVDAQEQVKQQIDSKMKQSDKSQKMIGKDIMKDFEEAARPTELVEHSDSKDASFDEDDGDEADANNELANSSQGSDGKPAPAQIIAQPPYYQPFQNPMQVPLNGPLKSINNIMISQSMNLINHPTLPTQENGQKGMSGQVLQVPLSKKQQRSQTVQNFIQYLTEFYDGLESQANILQGYYPKHIQKCIQKKKSQNTERIAQSIKVPSFFNGNASSKMSQKQMKAKAKKALHKMNLLTKFQATMMQVVLQKIDRRSKPIRKQTKIVTASLNKKQIFLEEENFDILQLLRQNNQNKDGNQAVKEQQLTGQNSADQAVRNSIMSKNGASDGMLPNVQNQIDQIKDLPLRPMLDDNDNNNDSIEGLNNIANLGEIDLRLVRNHSQSTSNRANETDKNANFDTMALRRDSQQLDSQEQPPKKLTKAEIRKREKEEKQREKERERQRKEAAKEERRKRATMKNEEKQVQRTDKDNHQLQDFGEAGNDLNKFEDQNLIPDQNEKDAELLGKKRSRDFSHNSPEYLGVHVGQHQQNMRSHEKNTAENATFGKSSTAGRKVLRPHMQNPYEVSSFNERQKIEELINSSQVPRPHKIGMDHEQQPTREFDTKNIQNIQVGPAQGAKHKQKANKKKKEKNQNNASNERNNSKGDAQVRQVENKGESQYEGQAYFGNANSQSLAEYPNAFPIPGSIGYNMHIGNVYYHQHHEHHHYGPPINPHLMFSFPGAHQAHQHHTQSFPPPPPGFYKHQHLNSNGSKHSGGRCPNGESTDDMIIQPMQQQQINNTTPRGALISMGAQALGSGTNRAHQSSLRTHTQTFHHHHFHPMAGGNNSHNQYPIGSAKADSQPSKDMILNVGCPKPPRGPMTIQTSAGPPGSGVYSPEGKLVTSTANNYEQQRNMGTITGARQHYLSVNQASAAMLCGGATGGFNHNISPSPQNNYKLGGNQQMGISGGGNTNSKEGSSLINLQPCQNGVEYHTNVGPGQLSGISEFVLQMNPVPINDKEKETPANNSSHQQLALHNQFRSMDIAATQPLFQQDAFSVAATADFMNNSVSRHDGHKVGGGVTLAAQHQSALNPNYQSSVTPKSALLKHDTQFFPTGHANNKSQIAAATNVSGGGNNNQNAQPSMLNIGGMPTPGVGASSSVNSIANVASLVQIVPGPRISGRSGSSPSLDGSHRSYHNHTSKK